jgi:acetyl esterase/lipase
MIPRTAFLHRALVLGCVFSLAGCSALMTVSRLTPDGHHLRTADVAFGGQPRQQLDVYRPREQSGPQPVVVFFYGGGWTGGVKEKYRFAASGLTKRGFVVVIPDYRVYPEVVFPAFVEDGAAAVRWVVDNIADYGGDPKQIFIMGHSAGAHIGALLSFDERYLKRVGVDAASLVGFIGMSGPYDFLPLDEGYLQQVFPDGSRAASQPVNFVDGAEAAVLLIHGSGDSTVSADNARRLAARIQDAGGEVDLAILDGAGHARPALALSPSLRFLAPRVLDYSVAFIHRRATHHATAATL